MPEQEAFLTQPFSIGRLPRIEFGAGSLARISDLVKSYGNRILLVTGANSLQSSLHWQPLLQTLDEHKLPMNIA